jgi:hypothetical protein
MLAILHALEMFAADMFTSRSRLEVENLFLLHITIALRRALPREMYRKLHPAMISILAGKIPFTLATHDRTAQRSVVA